jgi:uncharacterized protein with FMN-binding domain
MITPEFVKYVKQKLAIGFSKKEIANIAIKNGWTLDDLNEAFNAISKNLSVEEPSLMDQKIITMPVENRTRKKLTVSIGLILASIVYAFYQNTIPASSVTFENKSITNSSQGVVTLQTPPPSSNQVLPPQDNPPVVVPVKTPTSTPKPVTKPTPAPAPIPKPIPVPVPIPKPVGQYADGTYTGDPADAYYGTIQVEAIIQNGKLTDVQFLQHPSDRSTSVRINNHAMPILRQEAISAQSANVDTVSGATDSSGAFQQSLASALSQAKNS